MRITDAWPGSVDLGLPADLRLQLMQVLVTPFSTAEEAESFWNDCGGRLVILEDNDLSLSVTELPVAEAHWIDLALRYPDFTEPVGETHLASVAIINDAGAGLYLLCSLDHPLIAQEDADV